MSVRETGLKHEPKGRQRVSRCCDDVRGTHTHTHTHTHRAHMCSGTPRTLRQSGRMDAISIRSGDAAMMVSAFVATVRVTLPGQQDRWM
jgi:hypothetical protein